MRRRATRVTGTNVGTARPATDCEESSDTCEYAARVPVSAGLICVCVCV